jgi:hypothetical protein
MDPTPPLFPQPFVNPGSNSSRAPRSRGTVNAPYAPTNHATYCDLTVRSADGLPVQQPPLHSQAYPPALEPAPLAFPLPFAGVSQAPMIQATQQDISMSRTVTGQLVNGDPPPHHNSYPPPSIPQALVNRACISSGDVFDVNTSNRRPAIGNAVHSWGHGNTEQVSYEPQHLARDEQRIKGVIMSPEVGRQPPPKPRSEQFLSHRRL